MKVIYDRNKFKYDANGLVFRGGGWYHDVACRADQFVVFSGIRGDPFGPCLHEVGFRVIRKL